MIDETVTKLEEWQRQYIAYLDPSDIEVTMAKLEVWRPQMDAYLNSIKPPVPPPVTGLPKTRMGVHWICDLYRHSDVDYFNALRPAVIKMINPSPDRVREAMAAIDPNGHVALRYHPISEQHAEAKADPVGLAKAHAKYWVDQLNGPYREFDRSKLYVMGLNEPPISNDAEEKRQALYTETFLRELQPHGIRCYVFNFSVGWPREVDGVIQWQNFAKLTDLINATNSYGCVHEYWYPNVRNGWGSYANRISRCPMNIKFVIGECGYTRQLAGLPQPWGWDGNVSRETFADMLWEYADSVYPEKVFAVLPFTTSYGGIEWRSKDTDKAHAAILSRKHNYNWPVGWPVYDNAPPIEPPKDKSMHIIFPKITNKITGFYGQNYGYPHEGMDLSCVVGTPIYAPANGIVAYSAIDPAYGEYIRIYCPQLRTCFFYAHLSQRLVQYGNSVKQGQEIGRTGNTGNSDAPHLHFETRAMNEDGAYKVPKPGLAQNDIQTLYRRNGRVDPLGWLNGWEAAGGSIEYK